MRSNNKRPPVLLSRKSYREVVKMLEHYRKQHEEDRKENPDMIPIGWGIPLRTAIENIVRRNHERCDKGLADRVLDYLVSKGLLVDYAGDYTFPTDERLPTKQQIEHYAREQVKKLKNGR